MTDPVPVGETFRCGYAAVIGEPNVGKSTLLNSLLGQKISIVTPKPQTTRHKVLGILSTSEYQVIFVDTPGIIEPRYTLQEVMMRYASSALEDADVILVMVDVTRQLREADIASGGVFKRLRDVSKPVHLLLNKIDAVEKAQLLPMMEAYAKAFPFKELFPISALRGDGTGRVVQAVVRDLPKHPPLYPLDIVSEQQERFFVAEIIREKVFLKFREEVPYASTVEVVEFKDREEGKAFISANIIVERESQKGILIGKKGNALKALGQSARKDIERFLDRPVFLELHVKVRKQWRENEAWLSRLGYNPDE